MAIKKLQNNYTTQEQSKRLLELGLPVDSADLYSCLGFENLIWVRNTDNELRGGFFDAIINGKSANTPIWSIGRLIEIYLTCALEYHPYDDFYTETPSLHLMVFDKDRLVEEVIKIMSEDKMDFSKLEE